MINFNDAGDGIVMGNFQLEFDKLAATLKEVHTLSKLWLDLSQVESL